MTIEEKRAKKTAYMRKYTSLNRERMRDIKRRHSKKRSKHIVQRVKRWVTANKEYYRMYRREHMREKRKAARIAVIEAYGGKCFCCGESTPEFLAIDHINGRKRGDGTKDKKLGGSMYLWLINHNFPKDNYRLLCCNCNCARSWFGECPHERVRRENAA